MCATSSQGDRAGLQFRDHSDRLAQPQVRRGQTEDQGNGQPLSFYLPIHLVGEVFVTR